MQDEPVEEARHAADEVALQRPLELCEQELRRLVPPPLAVVETTGS
jgi:hypothetical protein